MSEKFSYPNDASGVYCYAHDPQDRNKGFASIIRTMNRNLKLNPASDSGLIEDIFEVNIDQIHKLGLERKKKADSGFPS